MPKEVKEEHLQEFMKALKEEFKKERPPEDPRIEHMLSRRRMPPEIVLGRLMRFNRRLRRLPEEQTWMDMARIVYEQWEKEAYPEEPVP